jgi:hypothetical protein
MKIIIVLLLIISLLLPQRIEAGIADAAIKGAGIYLIFQSVGYAVRKGSPIAINFAVKKLKKYIIKNPHKIPIINGIASAYIIENSDISNKLSDIAVDLELLSRSEAQEMIEKSAEYSKALDIVSTKLDQHDPDDYCAYSVTNMYNKDLTDFMTNASMPVALGDTGSFKHLRKKAVVGDELEHDHIPSSKAVKTYVARHAKKRLSKREDDLVHDNASALEISKRKHIDGRTYGGKNNSKIGDLVRFQWDSKNMKKATYRDFSYHLMNHNFNPTLFKPFIEIYKRNASLCLYQ